MSGNHGGCCVIVCLNEIPLQETAMVKGCQHTYWYKTLGSSVGFLEIIVLLTTCLVSFKSFTP